MRLAQDRVSYSEGAEHLQKAFPPRSMKNDELMYEASFLPLGKTEAEKLKAIKDFGDKFVKDCLDH